MRAYVVPLTALLLGLITPSIAGEAFHRTGWSVALGPRAQWIVGDGYERLAGGIGFGRGLGGEFHLSYGFTRYLAGRIAASSAKHSVTAAQPGITAGIAWASADAVLRLPVGRFDLVAFVRIGRQALAADGFGDPEEHTWIGLLSGVGGGLRIWLTPHISLGNEAAYARVRIRDAVATDGTGTPIPLGATYDGTTWGVALAFVEYHF